ncbi:ABC transporter permease [Sporosarcina siberiensis]|uniref:ABC transporter permease n=1 Tax=Sporosarcina siberiensis TaxID=1365606 RepID=A0ABW4SBK2_9BACL
MSKQNAANAKTGLHFQNAYTKLHIHPFYKYLIWFLGIPLHIFTVLYYQFKKKDTIYPILYSEIKNTLLSEGFKAKLKLDYHNQIIQKQSFFDQKVSMEETEKQAEKLAEERFEKEIQHRTMIALEQKGMKKQSYSSFFENLLAKPLFLIVSFIPGILMYALLLLLNNSYVKFIFERLVMGIFVVLGVVVLVFTILYISPFDPAANIIGVTGTKEQIAQFNHIYGLDLPYLNQLWNAVKGIFTFNLGNSFAGNEDVAASIANKFPVTLKLTLYALIMAIVVAIPIGIISATKSNSFFDYTFMFIALLGLSIPNFWQGLIFILNFSIKLQWLPATFSPQNGLSMIMPVVVLGTALTASVARMTRSSMLEIINEDYIITAKAKGLNRSQVLWKHAIGNAMIPIITVIGLLFGGMLGGAAVTEKVFNISGIGSYIVDKQFIPDIPAILGGVVYIAITISLVNIIIDILYAFFDPRIRSKMKQS